MGITYSIAQALDYLIGDNHFFGGMSYIGLAGLISLFLAPIFYMLKYIFPKKTSIHYAIRQLAYVNAALCLLCAAYLLAINFGRSFGFGMDSIVLLALVGILVIIFQARRSKKYDRQHINKYRLFALALTLAIYYGGYVADKNYFNQNILIQIVDTSGKPVEGAAIGRQHYSDFNNNDKDAFARTNNLGRATYSFDKRKYATFQIRKDNFKSVTVNLAGRIRAAFFTKLLSRSEFMDFGFREDKVAVSYSEDDGSYNSFMEAKSFKADLPEAERLLITVILQDIKSNSLADYSNTVYGPTTSDVNSSQLEVTNINPTLEDLQADDVIERLNKKMRYSYGSLDLNNLQVDDELLKNILAKSYNDYSRRGFGSDNSSIKSKLGSINLSHTKITDEGLKELAESSELREIDLSNTEISDEGINYIKSLPSLYKVDLTNTLITNKSIEMLSKNPKISYVTITGTKANCPEAKSNNCTFRK